MIDPSRENDDSLLARATQHHAIKSQRYVGKSADELRGDLYRGDLQLSKQNKQLQRLRQEIKRIQQRETEALRTAEAQKRLYQRQTERVDKFKTAYEKVKSSPGYRISRMAAAPARRLKRFTQRRSLQPLSTQELQNPELGTQATRSEPESAALQSASVSTTAVPESALTEAKRQFFKEGKINLPMQTVSSLGSDQRKTNAGFVEQLEAAERLQTALPVIIDRQPNPAYMARHDRVLYCAHSTGGFNSNGYSTRTAGLTKAMSKDGDVVVMARPGYPWDAKTTSTPSKAIRFEKVIDGVRHVFNPGAVLGKDPLDLYFIKAADIIVREATLQRAAVIHAASNHVTALPALIAARRLGIPFVYEVRGLWEITEASNAPEWGESERFALARSLEMLVARNSDQVLAITDQVRQELMNRGVSESCIDLLPNAADPYEFVPLPAERTIRSQVCSSESDVVIGYAGSILKYEGLDLLVEAFSKAALERPEMRLLIIGDGPALADLRSMVADRGLEDRVLFTGRVAADEVPRYMAAMDIVVCPRHSNLVTEMVSPIKPLEAMASGKPVVVSDVAPLTELMGTDGERGLIFRAGDSDDFAARLVELASNKEMASDIGRAARSWAVEHRSWTVMAQRVRESYMKLAARVGKDRTSGVELRQMSVALVSDEFTHSSLQPECHIVLPHPDTWKTQLDSQRVDALLVESAWEGNDGSWRGKVGYYDDESFKDLRKMVEYCRKQGIPTIFWNKEDPVHFNRFRLTAKIFEHVFTTDAGTINDYFTHRGSHNSTIGSLPFWAQARLHNPLPGRQPAKHTVAYGGTYYGDRYPERSRVLGTLLNAISPYGITIYDRQANREDSPYRFPEALRNHVQGGLSYPDMVQAYKAHPVHLNVNSVTESPTMYSRRVVELAASGTPVISGPGLGVDSVFGGLVPTPADAHDAALIAELWMGDELERNADAWEMHRHAFRAHMAGNRLAYALRVAGLVVRSPELPGYTLEVEELDTTTVSAILDQTHRPVQVLVRAGFGRVSSTDEQVLISSGIGLGSYPTESLETDVWCKLGGALHDTNAAEDLCRAAEFTSGGVQICEGDVGVRGGTLWAYSEADTGAPSLKKGGDPVDGGKVLTLRRHIRPCVQPTETEFSGLRVGRESRRILFAGHDLKFAGGIMGWLRKQGHQVTTDLWEDHSHHDVARSRELLGEADSVFCEWSLGNVEWYASNRRAGQRLTSRFHSQELFTPHLQRLDVGLVDHTIFVGELIRRVAIRRFGYLEAKTSVIPNALGIPLNVDGISATRRRTLGLVGIVPRQKHFDRALDVLAKLRQEDKRFTLRVKGRRPEEYPWMLKRQDEMAYYEALDCRIVDDPRLRNAVYFDPHGDDMAEWYGSIGVALSLSDFESFHLTLADGAASGALPLALAWPGAEEIYPRKWLHPQLSKITNAVQEYANHPDSYVRDCRASQEYVATRFSPEMIYKELGGVILGEKTLADKD